MAQLDQNIQESTGVNGKMFEEILKKKENYTYFVWDELLWLQFLFDLINWFISSLVVKAINNVHRYHI